MARISMLRDGDITLTSRYECKYLIHPRVVPDLRHCIEPFVRPDRFAACRPAHRYPVCTLYLDTDDLQLYRQTAGGDKTRFKLRLRTYSDDPGAPVFAEVKRRLDGIVQKRRARLTREHARELLRTGFNGWSGEYDRGSVSDAEYFAKLTRLSHAKPTLKVHYEREAYESKGGDPVRITIDTGLRHTLTLDDDLSHGTGDWAATPVDGVILEIKFTDRFPSWVHDLVALFGLKQQPAPKYAWSLEHFLARGHASALAVAGFRLPPRLP